MAAEAIEPSTAVVNGIRIHYERAGAHGPLLMLLHGWPETSHCWRHLVQPLAESHVVVAPDLRGYGHSDKPLAGYDKRTMASDLSELMRQLGFDRATVIGHDRGARVAHRWGLDRPDEVERMVVMDVLPTREVFRRFDSETGARMWHWTFHLQPDLPERLVGADVSGYLRFFFERQTCNREVFDPATIDTYVRAYSAPGALRASFDDYRAAFHVDRHQDDADHAGGNRLTMPVRVLWGDSGNLADAPALEIWSEYATDVDGWAITQCGHYLPEERPAEVLAALRGFLAGVRGAG
jgi:pimeloyl-ACP methyl ester carboxylesterase